MKYKDYIYDVLYYKNEPFCAISSYDSMAENAKLNIPSRISDIKVTTITDRSIHNDSLEEIVLPETVTTVGDLAFSDCDSLKKVYFTDNVSYIGESIFERSHDAVICAPKDSYAHQYATENDIKYEEYN